MENNKQQTAVEWLEQEMLKPNLSMKEILEQAKAMQKQQHGKTWDDAMESIKARGGNDMRAYTDFDDYYVETYGGNNE